MSASGEREAREQSLALLAETLAQRTPESALRRRLLDALHGPERWTQHAPDVARMFGLALADAQAALRRIHDPAAWQPGVWPGSTLLATPPLRARRTVIARLPAGLQIPRHRHLARELTYILDGVLLEDGKAAYGSGSLVDRQPESEHEVTVSAEAECLVVFSVLPA